jgi:hypothetical protein
MSLGSVEGLVVTLLFVLPGAVGIGLRNYLWAGKPLSSFEEILLPLAYSTAALILLEIVTGALGLAPSLKWHLGSYLTNDLLNSEFTNSFRTDLSLWYRFLGFGTCAVALPSFLTWLRRRKFLLKLKPARQISLYSDGFEALFEETRFEASKWDPRWTFGPDESPWLMVDTNDGRRYRGQMMWRSTAPDPAELILIEVTDITDPQDPAWIPGMLLLGGDTMHRLWVMRPDPPPAGATNRPT